MHSHIDTDLTIRMIANGYLVIRDLQDPEKGWCTDTSYVADANGLAEAVRAWVE